MLFLHQTMLVASVLAAGAAERPAGPADLLLHQQHQAQQQSR